jgi:predicted transcriptional regulator
MTAKRRADTREGMTVTTVALPHDVHRQLAIAAIEDSAAMTVLMRQAVEEWLDRRRKRAKGEQHEERGRARRQRSDG